jgi:hypothetical protein
LVLGKVVLNFEPKYYYKVTGYIIYPFDLGGFGIKAHERQSVTARDKGDFR